MMKKIRWIGLIAVFVTMAAGVWVWLFPDPHVAQGRELYRHYCAGCHGLKGRGEGFNATHLDPHPRDLTDSIKPYMAKASNEDIFTATSYGVAGIAPVEGEGGHKHVHEHGTEEGNGGDEKEAQGSPLMPYYFYTLSEEEIWSLVVYIRTRHDYEGEPVQIPEGAKKERPRRPVFKPEEYEALVKNVRGNKANLIQEGRDAYEKYGCNGCHWIKPEGGEFGPVLENVGFILQPQFIYRWVTNPQSLKPDTKMPNLNLTEKDALAITTYLTSLNERPQREDKEGS